jgi:hypothetical protein
LSDFIEGIDDLPERNVVDCTCNSYGEMLVDFLVFVNFAIMNGRNCVKNDFTCIRQQGLSVVDYCLVGHNSLHMYSDFTVIRSRKFVQTSGVHDYLGVPDHSVLTWVYNFENGLCHNLTSLSPVRSSASNVRFQVKKHSIRPFFW